MTHLEGHSLYLVLLPHCQVKAGFIQPRHLFVLQAQFHHHKNQQSRAERCNGIAMDFNYNSISDLTQ